MNERQTCRQLRREFGRNGWLLLGYYGVMNVSVVAVMLLDALVQAIGLMIRTNGKFSYVLWQEILRSASENAWGYGLAIAIGATVLMLWKKSDFCLRQIWRTERPLTAGDFFSLAALFFGAQALTQVLAVAMEVFFRIFGLSIMESMEAATDTGSSFSFFLYACLLAPVWEEILFRGLILRTLQPYGKKFAILASALLFGLFHGNIVQIPFAFAIGLVLGYVTVEHSMIWAVLLHLLNNLVLGDFVARFGELLPEGVVDAIVLIIVWGCAVASAVILIVRRREVKGYLTERKMHPWCLKSFFTAPGILVFSGVMLLNVLLSLLTQLV